MEPRQAAPLASEGHLALFSFWPALSGVASDALVYLDSQRLGSTLVTLTQLHFDGLTVVSCARTCGEKMARIPSAQEARGYGLSPVTP